MTSETVTRSAALLMLDDARRCLIRAGVVRRIGWPYISANWIERAREWIRIARQHHEDVS